MKIGMTLKEINMNLLLTLRTLLQERNVTKAARKLGMSQPALSNHLSQLRKIFDDPLLIRNSSGMVLSERAKTLQVPLEGALQSLEMAISSTEEFFPCKSDFIYNAVVTDDVLLPMILHLPGRIEMFTPNIKVHFLKQTDHLFKQLEQGEVDCAFGFVPNIPQNNSFFCKKLIQESFVCVAKKDHPILCRQELSLETYLSQRHILISPSGGKVGIVDRLLAEKKLKRNISMWVPDFYSALFAVSNSNMIVTMPRLNAKVLMDYADVDLYEPPIDLPVCDMVMVWHERTKHEKAYEWFRGRMAQNIKNLA